MSRARLSLKKTGFKPMAKTQVTLALEDKVESLEMTSFCILRQSRQYTPSPNLDTIRRTSALIVFGDKRQNIHGHEKNMPGQENTYLDKRTQHTWIRDKTYLVKRQDILGQETKYTCTRVKIYLDKRHMWNTP